jgi:hypothetical protein
MMARACASGLCIALSFPMAKAFVGDEAFNRTSGAHVSGYQ